MVGDSRVGKLVFYAQSAHYGYIRAIGRRQQEEEIHLIK